MREEEKHSRVHSGAQSHAAEHPQTKPPYKVFYKKLELGEVVLMGPIDLIAHCVDDDKRQYEEQSHWVADDLARPADQIDDQHFKEQAQCQDGGPPYGQRLVGHERGTWSVL